MNGKMHKTYIVAILFCMNKEKIKLSDATSNIESKICRSMT